MTSAERILAAKNYLRITYTANDLDTLKAKAKQVAEDGTFDEVTITGNSFTGGSATGIVTFPKIEYLQAITEFIQELDPTIAQAPDSTFYTDFSRRPVQA